MSEREPPRNPFEPGFDELPRTLPIFPLSGALLLPGARLPLNIFEPRYLAMTLDALAGGRVIGMVQPRRPGGFAGDGLPESDGGAPGVQQVGCAGRIVSFAETEDGRLLITLAGMCRFRIACELAPAGGYRRVEADYAPFRSDLERGAPSIGGLDRPRLVAALQRYFAAQKLTTDWKALDAVTDKALVASISMSCPFAPDEKQALLEAPDDAARARLLVGLLEIGAVAGGDDAAPRH